VLGAAKTFQGGPKAFYEARLNAAAKLYRAGRVRGIVVSGDNSHRTYSEPDDMKADLVRRGIPEAVITCDYAGLRTLDSVQRMHHIFGQQQVVIVSQRLHLERALFLAAADGLEATGFVAAEAPLQWWLRVRAREVFARGAALLDVTFGRGPRFLGPPEKVNLRE
jgi:SanA protein